MKVPAQAKQPSTYAGLGIIFTAIPALMASGFTDPAAWVQAIMGLIAIVKNEAPAQ